MCDKYRKRKRQEVYENIVQQVRNEPNIQSIILMVIERQIIELFEHMYIEQKLRSILGREIGSGPDRYQASYDEQADCTGQQSIVC